MRTILEFGQTIKNRRDWQMKSCNLWGKSENNLLAVLKWAILK